MHVHPLREMLRENVAASSGKLVEGKHVQEAERGKPTPEHG